VSDFIKHSDILEKQGKIHQSLKALWKRRPLRRAAERLGALTTAAALGWGVWDDSPGVAGKKQIHERQGLSLGPCMSHLQFSTLVICITLTPNTLTFVIVE